MEKIITLAVRHPSLTVAEYVDRYLNRHAVLAKRHRPRMLRYVVSFANVLPEESGRSAATRRPPYASVTETWYESLQDYTDPARAWDSEAGFQAVQKDRATLVTEVHTYHVREVVQKEYTRDWPVGERSPGIKAVYLVKRANGMTPAQFADHWRNNHGPLALKHHVGAWKYVQNVVLTQLTSGGQAHDGFAELHFPTARDMRERSIDSPEGGKIISDDVAKFVGGTQVLDCSEYVLIP